jgi:hypothetical protein
MSSSAHEKGRLLERAVELIERHILTVEHNLSDAELTIENRKIVNFSRVRSEIDLYVKIHASHGYDSVFIFECKNRHSSADKNDIIVFSEKIDITNAQHGFFVARSFGTDAIARAALDPRITLVTATIEELDYVTTFTRFEWRDINYSNVHVEFRSPNKSAQRSDMTEATFTVGGQPTTLIDYTTEWRNAAAARAMSHLTRDMVGEHRLTINDGRIFPEDHITVDGTACSAARLRADVVVRIHHPKIAVRVGIEGRGRVMRLEPMRTSTHEIETWISYSDDEEGLLRVEHKFTPLQSEAEDARPVFFEISTFPPER